MPNQTAPVTHPNMILLTSFPVKCKRVFLLSISQKISVSAIIDTSGINSAQNLQITALAVFGIGITDTHIAQPTKKIIVFIDTDTNFFM